LQVGLVTVKFSGLDALHGFYGPSSVRDFLTDAAEFLRSSVRSLDVVCRFGADGFGIILPDTGDRTAAVYDRLRRRFEQWMVAGSGARAASRPRSASRQPRPTAAHRKN